jgi:hypothetical protein
MGELLDLLSKRSRKSLLRFVNGEGREQAVKDLNHLYDLIRDGQIDYDTLVWDAHAEQWVRATITSFSAGLRMQPRLPSVLEWLRKSPSGQTHRYRRNDVTEWYVGFERGCTS